VNTEFTPQVYDAIIIGGGHNGLVTAGYLGRSGLKTLVLESRTQLGGAASTEEVFPGYLVDTGSFDASLFLKRIISELGLEQYDLKMMLPVLAFAPHVDNIRYHLAINRRHWKRSTYISKRCQTISFFDCCYGSLLREVWMLAPPNLPEVKYGEIFPWLGVARKLRKSGRREMMEFVRVLPMPLADYLDEWFESPWLKGVLGSQALLGSFQGPRSPGTMYNFLHTTLGAQVGQARSCQPVRAMGRLAEALASAARERGAEIRLSSCVEKILIEAGQARGVILDSGEIVHARVVVSSAPPRQSFFDLVLENLEVCLSESEEHSIPGLQPVFLAWEGCHTFGPHPHEQVLSKRGLY
jgi:phytoene dehydrogenase-like protein